MPEDRHNAVRSTRKRRQKRRKKFSVVPLVFLAAITTSLIFAAGSHRESPVEAQEEPLTGVTLLSAVAPEEIEEGEDPHEADKIEQALVEQGYFRYDVPLDFIAQDFLHTACEEAGIPYSLALAVIQRETQFRNIIGDDGASEGYMQVQRQWHQDRVDRLGVTDLMDPFSNFRVGCDYLAELLGKYPLAEALTAYNGGSPGLGQYSEDVMNNYEKWKELVGNEVSGCEG